MYIIYNLVFWEMFVNSSLQTMQKYVFKIFGFHTYVPLLLYEVPSPGFAGDNDNYESVY